MLSVKVILSPESKPKTGEYTLSVTTTWSIYASLNLTASEPKFLVLSESGVTFSTVMLP